MFKKYLTIGIGYHSDEIIFENPNIDSYIYGQVEMRYLKKMINENRNN